MSNREPLAVRRVAGNDTYLRSEASVFDPARLVRTLRRQFIWLLLPPLLAGGLGGYLASRQPDLFEATTILALQQTAAQDRLDGDRSNALAERDMQTEAQLLDGPAMEALVEQELGVSLDFGAEAVEGTDLIELTADGPSPELAAEYADSVAAIYLSERRARILADLEAGVLNVEDQIVRLEAELAEVDAELAAEAAPVTLVPGAELTEGPAQVPEPDPALLRRQRRLEDDLVTTQRSLDELASEMALTNGDVRIAAAATPPSGRVSPNPVRSAVLWSMLGLLFGFGFVWLRESLDRRVHGISDIGMLTAGLDFAGEIPRPNTESLIGPAAQLIEEVADRFRVLANNSLSNSDHPLTIQVTGTNGGEGSTFVAVNLAATLAAGGWATVLVDANLIRGDIHEVFGVESTPGTRQLLYGKHVSTAVQTTSRVHGLGIVAKGSRTTAEATVHNTALADMLKALGDQFDIVILDGPPMLKSGDAAVLAQHVDKTILVAALDETELPDLEAAVELVTLSGGRLTGIAMTNTGGTTVNKPAVSAVALDQLTMTSDFEPRSIEGGGLGAVTGPVRRGSA